MRSLHFCLVAELQARLDSSGRNLDLTMMLDNGSGGTKTFRGK